MAQPKLNLAITGKDAASAEVKKLEKRLKELGGETAVKTQKQIKKLNSKIKTLGGESKKTSKIFSKFTSGIAIGNIAATAATAIFTGVIGALKGTIDAAAQTEVAWNLVTASLERHGLASEENIASVKRFADEMQTLTGVADEEYGGAVRRMVDAGQDLSTSFEAVTAAADIAASTGKDTAKIMNQISDAIIKEDVVALEKWTGAIDTNLPFSQKLDIALGRINDKFGGAAAANADTYAVKIAVMGQKFGDLQEKIGGLVLPILTELANVGIAVVDSLMEVFDVQFPTDEAEDFEGALKGITTEIGNIADTIGPWVKMTVGAVQIMVNAMGLLNAPIDVVRISFWNFIKAITQAIQGDFSGAWDTMKSTVTEVKDSVVTDWDDMLSGVDKFTDGFKNAMEEVKQSAEDATGGGGGGAGDDGSGFGPFLPTPAEVTARAAGLQEIAKAAFEASLIGLTDFQQKEEKIYKEFSDRILAIDENKNLTKAEKDAAVEDLNALREEELNAARLGRNDEQHA